MDCATFLTFEDGTLSLNKNTYFVFVLWTRKLSFVSHSNQLIDVPKGKISSGLPLLPTGGPVLLLILLFNKVKLKNRKKLNIIVCDAR